MPWKPAEWSPDHNRTYLEKMGENLCLGVDYFLWWTPGVPYTGNHGDRGMNTMRAGGQIIWLDAELTAGNTPAWNYLYLENFH